MLNAHGKIQNISHYKPPLWDVLLLSFSSEQFRELSALSVLCFSLDPG